MHRLRVALFLLLAALSVPSRAFLAEPAIGSIPGALNGVELPNGELIDLAAFRGSPVVVYVGAEWCVPCVTSGRPAVLRVYEKFRDRGLKVVYVSLDDNLYRSALREWAEPLGISLLMAKRAQCPDRSCAKGSNGNLGSFGRAYRYPTAFVIDAQGVVRERYEVARDIRTKLEGFVEPLLTKQ